MHPITSAPTGRRLATTVRRIASECLPTPDARRELLARARRDAEALADRLPEELGWAAFAAWCDANGIDADPRYRRELQQASVMLRMARTANGRRKRGRR